MGLAVLFRRTVVRRIKHRPVLMARVISQNDFAKLQNLCEALGQNIAKSALKSAAHSRLARHQKYLRIAERAHLMQPLIDAKRPDVRLADRRQRLQSAQLCEAEPVSHLFGHTSRQLGRQTGFDQSGAQP